MELPSRVYQVHENDNVGTAIEKLETGDHEIWLENRGVIGSLRTLSEIPRWFKVALQDIDATQFVVKFGYSIGAATVKISKGAIVHRGNVVFENHEEVVREPLVIKNRFEVGMSLRCLPENEVVEIGKDAVIDNAVAKKLGGKSMRAATVIPSRNVLYCGNMLEEHGSGWRIRSDQLGELEMRFKSIVKEMDGDMQRYLEHLYPHIKFYNLLKMQLFLREISERKGR
jgi:hypothetical protein